ncbi:MAG: STAS domain-containing protein [Gammaproteobacteria bacterium]|nr:STAS domain-containing protein [Gammaproteobacteria bacterium]MDX2461959.1 STAS domain-containing protein [Gammaproteobacteria bacterium]
MSYMTHNLKDDVIVVLDEELDAQEVATLQPQLQSLVERPSGDIVVDMTAVTFIDSSGVGALVFLYKRLVAQGRDMILVGLQGQPRDMLRLLRIDKTVSTFESLNAYIRVHAQFSAAESEVIGG